VRNFILVNHWIKLRLKQIMQLDDYGLMRIERSRHGEQIMIEPWGVDFLLFCWWFITWPSSPNFARCLQQINSNFWVRESYTCGFLFPINTWSVAEQADEKIIVVVEQRKNEPGQRYTSLYVQLKQWTTVKLLWPTRRIQLLIHTPRK